MLHRFLLNMNLFQFQQGVAAWLEIPASLAFFSLQSCDGHLSKCVYSSRYGMRSIFVRCAIPCCPRISDHWHQYTGVYCVLFMTSIVILIKRYRGSNRVIWVANCLLFITSTAHFALAFNHLYVALVRNNSLWCNEDLHWHRKLHRSQSLEMKPLHWWVPICWVPLQI